MNKTTQHSLNQLVEFTLNALHKLNIENKTWLCQAIRAYLKQDNLDICERFKGNVALRLLIDDIDSHVNTIQDIIHGAA